MEWIKSIMVGAIFTAFLIKFVYAPFGEASYILVIIISLLVILGCAAYLWIRKK